MIKRNVLISLFLISAMLVFGQDIIPGEWDGVLNVQGIQLHVVFHITKTDTGYSATMDSPDQGAKDIPMSKATFENQVLSLDMAAAQINYTGKPDKAGIMVGTFHQGGQSFPLNLTRKAAEVAVLKPQQVPANPDGHNSITGEWNGVLKVQGIQLRLVFHITKNDTGYSATMDSPDQGAKDIPMSKVTYENQVLTIDMAAAQIEYTGKPDSAGVVVGTFTQAGQSLPLNLTHKAVKTAELKRPQDPVKPYPYYQEEVSIENAKDNLTLAGTLTLPQREGKFPAVILITGSGPQNRDEELMGHRPFLVLSDYLTRNGIVVLRCDDRGTFGSKGDFAKSTTFDFATDVEAEIRYLMTRKEIDHERIGLIGHSEGGIIAPLVALSNKNVRFIVLMAGTGISGDKLLLLQQELIGRASGIKEDDLKETADINRGLYDLIIQSNRPDSLNKQLTDYIKFRIRNAKNKDMPKGMTEDDIVKQELAQLSTPWIQCFIRYNPLITLERVKCPVLAINGSKDLQVPSKVNLPAIEKALEKGGNKRVTIKELPGLNHLFQECTTGLPKEYSEIEQTISPVALETITSWIKQTIK